MKDYPINLAAMQRQVNYALERKVGLGLWDLPDTINFQDFHWEGMTKEEFWDNVEAATNEILDENGLESELY